MNGEPTLHARTAADWCVWLDEHAALQRAVWLITYHKRSPTPSILVPEAVEQALCFGWIDSHARKRDAESFYLRFTPRRPRSNWSQVNRARAEKLIAAGLMRPAGQPRSTWPSGPGAGPRTARALIRREGPISPRIWSTSRSAPPASTRTAVVSCSLRCTRSASSPTSRVCR
ncbi:hypothetical protein SAMN05421810_109145 [Amycolatopsis arida]|uniref:Bacteriocin-protection, YdeI or OmpD-Associated n=2 Tax=Amycolatopsis arida TaxID=587909 RepID=A0A1I5ZFH8_9PSEU|nr:hypothetical protein CLV69_109144 [Amycolatopsis arida]SFQ55180.1 hypothetical protein SAMN05421810_109145 [Amycolatopsis arida]